MSSITPARIEFRQWLLRFPRAFPLVIFLLTLVVIGISVYAIEKSETQKEKAQLQQIALAVGVALERRADAHAAYLRASSALLSHQDAITGEGFSRLVSELKMQDDFRGAENVGWGPVVSHAQIPAFEKRMTEEYGRAFKIYPALRSDQAYAIPLTYVLPANELTLGAIGLNMLSDGGGRGAMKTAATKERPVASDKLVLIQGRGLRPDGFVMYMPVFEPHSSGKRVRGFVTSAFNAQKFLESALHSEPLGRYGVRLYDRSIAPDRLLAQANAPEREGMTVVRGMTIATHPWVLQVRAPQRDTLSPLSLLTMIAGLLIASLLMVVARLLTQQALEDRLALAWLEQQNSIRLSLTRELNHRVKNTLANVLSLIALTRRRATDLDSFVDGLDGRIRALSATHNLLTQSEWGATPIRAVIETELAPYAKGGEHLLTLTGPDIELAPNDALSLGLAIHELATNAAKYGALSTAQGSVAVSWHLVSDTLARIEWVEKGGPPVHGEGNRGFGLDLIEKIVAHELGNPVDLRFEPHGVECALTVPVRQASEFAIRARRQPRQSETPPSA